MFVSKFRATTAFLAQTPLSMFMEGDLHELHIYCGWTILICSLIHGVAHVVRWAAQGHLSLLHSHFSGITGMIIFLSMILICIPMTIFRKTIQYEIRKYLHYFFLVFALALCFHSPKSAIPNGGFAFYELEVFLCGTCWTHRIARVL